jgi:1-hydroxycarotenoid 3,4-desaturase
MRWIFEQLFSDCGSSLEGALKLSRPDLLARHAWREGGQLDLLCRHRPVRRRHRCVFGRADAQGYRDFCARSRALYETLEHSFIAAQQPSPAGTGAPGGLQPTSGRCYRQRLSSRLWSALGKHFTDPRLRQLFGRYSTYVGSSPWLTPATLMLVAHVEQDGVWLVDGGMHAVALALAGLGSNKGARYRFNAHVDQIVVEGGRAAGVRLADGEVITADAIVFNGDVSALGTGLLGASAASAAQSLLRRLPGHCQP